MYSIIFECLFTCACLFEGEIYSIGEKDYFSLILTADSFSCAVDRAFSYAEDHFEKADVSIVSIVRISTT